MFAGHLSMSNGAILVVYLIFTSLLILLIFSGRLILWIYGSHQPTALNGAEIWTKLENQHSQSLISCTTTGRYFSGWLHFQEKHHRLIVSEKTWHQKNLHQLAYCFSLFASTKNSYSQNRIYRYQYWGLQLLFCLILINTLTIFLVLFLGPRTQGLNGGDLILGAQIALQALVIFGWFVMILLYLWWVNLNQTRNSELLDLARKYLSPVELSQLKKYLKIQALCLFSIHY